MEAPQRPVLLKGYVASQLSAALTLQLSRADMLKRWGERTVTLQTVPYAETYLEVADDACRERHVPLSQVLHEENRTEEGKGINKGAKKFSQRFSLCAIIFRR